MPSRRSPIPPLRASVLLLAMLASCSGDDGEGPIRPVVPTGGIEGWAVQAPMPGNGDLLGVAVIDADNAVVVGEGGRIARRRVGQTWVVQPSGTDETLRAVSFATPSLGIAVGDNGTILRTSSGGASWGPVSSTATADLYGVVMFTPLLGVLAGHGGALMSTINGGSTWIDHSQDATIDFTAAHATTADSVFVVGAQADTAVVLLSTDGGATWTRKCCAFERTPLGIDSWNDRIEVWGIGGGLTSPDGGETWSPWGVSIGSRSDVAIIGPEPVLVWTNTLVPDLDYAVCCPLVPAPAARDDRTEGLTSVEFDGNTGWAAGLFGAVLRSADRGLSWETEVSTGLHDVNGLFFVDAHTGWAVSDNQNVYHTGDAGRTWIVQRRGTGGSFDAVWFLDANRGFAVGYTGTETLFETSNGGTTWNPVGGVPASGYGDVMFVDDMTGYLCGDDVILRTANGGASWSVLDDGRGDIPQYRAVWFVDPDTGWAAGDNNLLMRTYDAGASWDSLGAIASGQGFLWDVYFRTAREGWLAGYDTGPVGLVLHTDDGGDTWSEQYAEANRQMFAIHFADAMTGWAVGGLFGDRILRTTDGGASWIPQSGTGGARARLRDVWAIDALTATAAGDFGVILRTENGGIPAN